MCAFDEKMLKNLIKSLYRNRDIEGFDCDSFQLGIGATGASATVSQVGTQTAGDIKTLWFGSLSGNLVSSATDVNTLLVENNALKIININGDFITGGTPMKTLPFQYLNILFSFAKISNTTALVGNLQFIGKKIILV